MHICKHVYKYKQTSVPMCSNFKKNFPVVTSIAIPFFLFSHAYTTIMIDTPIYSHPDLTPRTYLESKEREQMYKRWRVAVDKLLHWHDPTRSFIAMVLCMTAASLLTSSPSTRACPIPWICSTLTYMTGLALLTVYSGAWVLRNQSRTRNSSWVLDDATMAALFLTWLFTVLTSLSSMLVTCCLAFFLTPVAVSARTGVATDIIKRIHVSTT